MISITGASAQVVLDADDDVAAALAAIAALLAAKIDPDAVAWRTPSRAGAALFDPPAPSQPVEAERLRKSALPACVAPLARTVLLCDEPDRFRIFHRWSAAVSADPARAQDLLDADRVALERMSKAVRTAVHKMHAFVRFVPVQDADGTRYIAFHEPPHFVVRAAAPFFVKRFASMRWSILTPRGSLEWDGARLQHGPAASRADAPVDDAGDQLWLDYYRSTFNPARLNAPAMTRHMARHYWPTLPEARLIPQLVRDADAIAQRMQQHTELPTRRLPRALRDAASAPVALALPSADALVAAEDRRAAHRALSAAAAACAACPLHEHATQTVFGRGAVHARMMLVGEQPGDREDLTGRPFVGPAGELLQQAIAQLGWPRDLIYATNAVKHFWFELRGKRRIHKSPTQAHIAACLDWLDRELALVQPKVVVALGRTAARALLGAAGGAVPFGTWAPSDLVLSRCRSARVFVLQHPSAVLRAGHTGQALGYEDWVSALAAAGCAFDDGGVNERRP